MRENFSPGGLQVDITKLLKDSVALADKFNHQYVTVDHVVRVLLDQYADDDKEFFTELGISASRVVKELDLQFDNGTYLPRSPDRPQAGGSSALIRFQNAMRKLAMLQSITNDQFRVTIGLYLRELLEAGDCVSAKIIKEFFNITIQDIVVYLEETAYAGEIMPDIGEEAMTDAVSSKAGSEALKKYCDDITAQARDGKVTKTIGRDREIAEIAQVMSRKNKNNAILVGEPGVGKTQIVEGLALAIVKGKVCDSLKSKRILSMNIGSMMAGTKFRGEFEQRVEDVINALTKDDILFIDEMHSVMGAGAGSDGKLDFVNLIKPKLSRGGLRLIGATTYDDFQTTITKDQAFARRFLRIDVKEPTKDETLQIIKGLQKGYEEFHKVTYSNEAITAIMNLSEKYIHTKRWPDKAIDLLDSSGARNNATTGERKDVLGANEIAVEAARMANLPVEALLTTDTTRMANLKTTLESRVFGQDEAVQKLTESVLIARAGLRGKNIIQGGYLFVGPSGVGKTEIAKALSETLACPMIRFDMSEFMESHSISKLIGSPPGYVGHDQGNGKLIDELDKHPDCILLLDEVEKAHKDIFNLFLQALDEGSLTSSTGKRVSLQNVTLIMTTNLGAKNAQVQGIGFSNAKMDDGITKAIKDHFRPEFLNRLDSIVRFNDLSQDTRESVAKKFIGELNGDLKEKNVKVVLGDAAIQWIVTKGTEPGMGARPMKRVIHEFIKKPMASELLFGGLVNGGKATFTVKGDELVMKVTASKAVSA